MTPSPIHLITVAMFGLAFIPYLVANLIRLRRSENEEYTWFNRFVEGCFSSLGLSVAIGLILLPSVWLNLSLFIKGGTVENNLPPGIEAKGLFVAHLAGSLLIVAWAFKAYWDNFNK